MLNQQHQQQSKPKNSSSKDLFLKMLPQINTPTNANLRKMDSFTTSSRSTNSQKPSPRFESRKSSNLNDLVNPISDYFDPNQIHSAVSKTTDVSQRIKILDHVLWKRRTIVESEKKNQMDRIAPMVKNYVGNFRVKGKSQVQTPKVNKFRNSVRNINFDQTPSSQTDSFTADPDLVLSARFNTDNYFLEGGDGFNSLSHRQSTLESSSPSLFKPLPIKAMHQSSSSSGFFVKDLAQLESEKQLNLISLTTSRVRSESKNTAPSSASSQRRGGIMVNFSKEMIIGTFKNLMKEKFQNTHQNFSSFKPPPVKKVKRPVFVPAKRNHEANLKLEKDIFNFLMKNGEPERDALQKVRLRKDSKIQIIEAKAFEKYKDKETSEFNYFKEDQRRSSHQTPLQTVRLKLHK